MAPRLPGKWIKIYQKDTSYGPGARGSPSITVVGNKMYSFGGDLVPLNPVDNYLYVFDLETQTWSVESDCGSKPNTRVGTGMVAIDSTLYVFGGRDLGANRKNDFYSYDTCTHEWKRLSSGDDQSLLPRSYHSMAADDENVYVFGGSGNESRLKTLHGYNVVENKWVQYPTPGESLGIRGGAGLAVVNRKIWVVYGFCGKEMDDVHYFDLATGEWTQVETTGKKPSPRSVFATAVVGKYILIFGGELEMSPRGHSGAGAFSRELHGLDTETLEWTMWEDDPGAVQPERRGWCGFANAVKDCKEGLLLYGGTGASNERLDDIYFFTPY